MITKQMDSSQLREVLSRDLGRSFGGVYPRDLLPDQLRPHEKAIVINTDSHDQPGTHWVCLYCNGAHVEYFDSYRLPLLHQEIRQFISRHVRHWTYNQNCFQDYSTDVCGHY